MRCKLALLCTSGHFTNLIGHLLVASLLMAGNFVGIAVHPLKYLKLTISPSRSRLATVGLRQYVTPSKITAPLAISTPWAVVTSVKAAYIVTLPLTIRPNAFGGGFDI